VNNLQKYLVDEFLEDFSEGRLSRRDALKMIGGVLGSLALANTLLAGCAPQPSPTATAGAAAGATASPAVQPTNTGAPPTGTPAAASTTESTAAPTGTSEPASTSTAASAATPNATATTAATAEAAQPASTAAAQINIPENDPAIQVGALEFPSGDATVKAYLARPAGEGQHPAVLVCHENRGLTDYIRDVARRLAKAGYVALAVDLLSRQGGTAAISDPADVPGILGQAPPEQFVQDFQAGWTYLKGQPFVRPGGVGMVGFCFGGGVTWRVAAKLADLKAAVPFYGPVPPVEEVPGIQAAVLGIYGGNDQRVNQGIPTVEAAMKQNGKTYEKMIYPNADHAFHNDTGTRYNADAARDAWTRTLAWFSKYLDAS
jgi:carboxymethylenebutenolidase